jgi:hypothetical protein
MDLQAALRARLVADAAIASVVGQRVYWGIRPQGTPLPAIVLTKVAPGQEWTHAGPDTMVNPWVQIDVYADNYPSAGGVIDAVQAEMQRLDRVEIEAWEFVPPAVLTNEQWPGVEGLPEGGLAHRVTQDYRFWAQPA